MAETHQKGKVSEAAVELDLIKQGFAVLEPKTKQPFDMVIESENEYKKIQVKSGRLNSGSVITELKRTNMTSSGAQDKFYTSEEVDIYAIYCPELEECFYVPFDEAPKTQLSLRVDEERTKYASEVRWAKDYRKI